jgi:PAS domain S-box-containing protein
LRSRWLPHLLALVVVAAVFVAGWTGGAGAALAACSAALAAALAGAIQAARARSEASEQRFRNFMENTPNAVFLKDAAGRYVFMNKAAEALIGGASWRGRTDRDLLSPATAERIAAHDRQVLETDRPHTYELALPQPDGERRLFSSKFPLRDADGRRYVASITVDVTDRKRTEEELQLVTDTMSAAVVRCSADLRVQWANRIYCQWMARSFDDLVGRPLAEVIGPTALEEIRGHIGTVMRGEHVRYERRVEYPGLGRRWVGAVYSPTFDSAARASGWVAVVYDIDERKRMEEALAEANRRKDEFLATLAHELRNPLAPIRNAVTLLGRERALPPEMQWSRGVIERQVEQMARLIDDLLDVARISSGKLLLRRQPTTLAGVVEMALETSRPHIDAARHRLSLDLAAGDAWLDGDPTRLAQVLANLLNNAAKYTPPGGEIRLAAAREGDRVAIDVADSGIGFAPEAAAELFEPFTQRAGPQHAAGGLGIGLALVRGIVQLHGGTVSAHSEGDGHGSRFVVRLPLAAPSSASSLGNAQEQAASPGIRVLVVDDNRDAADSLARLLAIFGHEVRVAYDGAAAVSLAGDFRPRAVVLDIGMPLVDGYQAARRVREILGAQVLLVAATGWGQETDRRRAAQAGFDHHLTKPVDPAALDDLLRSCS